MRSTFGSALMPWPAKLASPAGSSNVVEPTGQGVAAGGGVTVPPCAAATAAATSTRPWPLSNDVVAPSWRGSASYAAPNVSLRAVASRRNSISPGVSDGSASFRMAT